MRNNISKCLLITTLALVMTTAVALGCADKSNAQLGAEAVGASASPTAETPLETPETSEIQLSELPTVEPPPNEAAEEPSGDITLLSASPQEITSVEDKNTCVSEIIRDEMLNNVIKFLKTPEPTLEPTPTPEAMTSMYYVPGYVNTDFLNLRQEPTTESKVLRVLRFGTRLYIMGRNSDWYKVEVDGVEGYMAKEYVALGYYETTTPAPIPTVTPKPSSQPMYTVYEGQFSESDIRLVAALIHCEGMGSTRTGYRALASIVLNRVLNSSRWFPDDVPGVIFQQGQFGGYTESFLESITPNETAMDAARYVFSTHGATLPKMVLFYRSAQCGYEWTSYTRYYATIEGNNYYYGLYHY